MVEYFADFAKLQKRGKLMNFSHLKKRQDLKKYVCNMKQIAGITQSILDDGTSRGVRIAEINNGSGLNFTVIPDKGMDIGAASCCGVPFAWLSPGTPAHPAYFDANGIGWLRSWGGGLLTGCGMVNAGAPSPNNNGEEGGLHGRLSNIPAENFSYKEKWVENEYVLTVTGKMREARLFGENILLTREITTKMGKNVIEIKDTVKNEGCRPSPLMLLYHINIGYPMIDEVSTLKVKDHNIIPRDDDAVKGIDSWQNCATPDANFTEQCFYHDIPVDKDGLARIAIVNTDLGMELEVAYRKAELPFLTQWKMMGQGEYVMGIEPANCHPEGQVAEKDKFDSLRILQPEESFETFVQISINCLNVK
jgi:uncharacterized protein DUF4432